eukprot:Platyproteum_vivax@DN5328_c0_g1_i1.p1
MTKSMLHDPPISTLKFENFKCDSVPKEGILCVCGFVDLVRGFAKTGWFDCLGAEVKGDLVSFSETTCPGFEHQTGSHANYWRPNIPTISFATVTRQSSRHNCPARSDQVDSAMSCTGINCSPHGYLILLAETVDHLVPLTVAASRLFPRFHANKKDPRNCVIMPVIMKDGVSHNVSPAALARLASISQYVRQAALMVDLPCKELDTDIFLEKVKTDIKSMKNVSLTVISGKDLEAKGYGGMWNVGKCAVHLPHLAIVTYKPTTPVIDEKTKLPKTMCWVGKGIVYDTGGLCLKDRIGMTSMKDDCGGAGACFNAFCCAVEQDLIGGVTLHAILCLAENAIGPEALRPDDIIKLYSGVTVEISDTDYEGRLVMADGVAHATQHLAPQWIVDMATLTYEQKGNTGRLVAGLLSNNEETECMAVKCGKLSGDVVYPMIYTPEYQLPEYVSKIATMKNSGKDRDIASASTAGLFMEQQFDPKWKGNWIHIDIAGPAYITERGTGFGVAILLQILSQVSAVPVMDAAAIGPKL